MNDRNDRTNRRRLGRPPKPLDEVRSRRVVSFVTRDELDSLTELADIRGESLSAVVHRILRSALLKQNFEEKGLPEDSTKNELSEQGE